MAPARLYVMFDSPGGEFEKACVPRVLEIHPKGPREPRWTRHRMTTSWSLKEALDGLPASAGEEAMQPRPFLFWCRCWVLPWPMSRIPIYSRLDRTFSFSKQQKWLRPTPEPAAPLRSDELTKSSASARTDVHISLLPPDENRFIVQIRCSNYFGIHTQPLQLEEAPSLHAARNFHAERLSI